MCQDSGSIGQMFRLLTSSSVLGINIDKHGPSILLTIMMPIAQLMIEHRLIERMVALLEDQLQEIREETPTPSSLVSISSALR